MDSSSLCRTGDRGAGGQPSGDAPSREREREREKEGKRSLSPWDNDSWILSPSRAEDVGGRTITFNGIGLGLDGLRLLSKLLSVGFG